MLALLPMTTTALVLTGPYRKGGKRADEAEEGEGTARIACRFLAVLLGVLRALRLWLAWGVCCS